MRFRELGYPIGQLTPGEFNAITDVPGVRVGHSTLIWGEGDLLPGSGPVRTGTTIILAHGGNLFQEKVQAAVVTLNGFGKPFGFEQIRELGLIESPIALTNTLNVSRVADALVEHALHENPDIGIRTGSVNVVVGETNDGYLNDLQGRHVQAEHVWSAIAVATDGPVAEGAVGAGTGTICFGWKGGIGSASRRLADGQGGYTLGALVQSNFGGPKDLLVLGIPVGRKLAPPAERSSPSSDAGSIMIVLATDAPLTSRQLKRLAKRAGAGLARTGSYYGHGSGDFVIVFSTTRRVAHVHREAIELQQVFIDEAGIMPWLFRAVIETVEEAILNSLSAAATMTGRDGHIAYALPLEQVAELLKRYYPV